jgi:hypothetical protein
MGEPRHACEDKNRLPLHSDDCPDYDGETCSRLGFRPGRICEPSLLEELALFDLRCALVEKGRVKP